MTAGIKTKIQTGLDITLEEHDFVLDVNQSCQKPFPYFDTLKLEVVLFQYFQLLTLERNGADLDRRGA